MYFQRHEPSPFFSIFIDCYFSIDTSLLDIKVKDLVIPDGTFGLIFVDNESALSRSLNTVSGHLPLNKTSIFGQKTHAVHYHMSPLKSKVFGLKIKPNGIPLFTNEIQTIQNVFENIDALNNKALLTLEAQVLEAKTVIKKIAIVENYIMQEIQKATPDQDFKLMQSMMNFIFKYKGNLRLDILIEYFNVNYKKIERLFLKYTGMPPKSYIRIIRINACIDVTKFQDKLNLTVLALDNGFFDQSHLTKEFKRITSLTPKQFFQKERSYSEVENLNIINRRWQKI